MPFATWGGSEMRHWLVAIVGLAACGGNDTSAGNEGVASATDGAANDGSASAGEWGPASDGDDGAGGTDGPNGDDSGDPPGDDPGGDPGDDTGGDDGSGETPAFDLGSMPEPGDGDARCDDFDFQISLHREVSMNLNLDGVPAVGVGQAGNWSRWFKAMEAIENAAYDHHDVARLGLELHPGAIDGCEIFTVSGHSGVTGETCQDPDVISQPALHAGPFIDDSLDFGLEVLCNGGDLAMAAQEAGVRAIDAAQDGGRIPHLVLVTHGAQGCDDHHELRGILSSFAVTDGLETIVVGLPLNDDLATHALFNDLACAGHSAVDFPAGCTDMGGGHYLALDPEGPRLYVDGTDPDGLSDAIATRLATCTGGEG